MTDILDRSVNYAARHTTMTPPTDTRTALVQNAASLWHARSYADVGVSEICEAAGVRKGSFYHFFPSKSALALAVLETRREQAADYIFGPASKRGSSPLERLVAITEIHYELQSTMKAESGSVLGCPIGNLALELSTQDAPVRERCAELLGDWASVVAQLLAEAVEVEELPPIDVERASSAVVAYAQGLLLLAKTRNDAELIKDLGSGAKQLAAAFERTPHQ